jgi:hypothetical protein
MPVALGDMAGMRSARVCAAAADGVRNARAVVDRATDRQVQLQHQCEPAQPAAQAANRRCGFRRWYFACPDEVTAAIPAATSDRRTAIDAQATSAVHRRSTAADIADRTVGAASTTTSTAVAATAALPRRDHAALNSGRSPRTRAAGCANSSDETADGVDLDLRAGCSVGRPSDVAFECPRRDVTCASIRRSAARGKSHACL